MFPRCEYAISRASTTLAQNVYGASGSVSRTHSGNSVAAASDAAETYPESHSVAPQMGNEIASASGASARNIPAAVADRKSTRLNSSHSQISYAVFCLEKKKARKTPY